MTNKVPQLSVIMPTFNCEKFISEAINSVLRQTFSDFELIIVDNESTDGTLEIINSYTDSRIQITQCRNNGVIAKSRNIGVEMSRSKIIAFLDADDFWCPTKLAECFPMIGINGDVVYHSEYWFDEEGNFKETEYASGNRTKYRTLLYRGNVVSTSSVVVKKAEILRVGGFCEKESYKTAEDYDLWLRMSKNGNRFVYLKRVLGAYRIHSANSIKQEEIHEKAMIAVLTDHFRLGQMSFLQSLRARRRMSLLFAESGFTKARNGEVKNSLYKFLKAMTYYPLGYRGLALLVGSILCYLRIYRKKL
jgi:glycosyltransferase involved in cell wall biosynthesis